MPKAREERRRPRRVAGLIQDHLSRLFIQEVQPAFSSLITITRVEMTPDLLTARIFLTVLGTDDPAGVVEWLEKKKNALRRSIASTVNLKYNPSLFFEIDRTPEWESRIDQLISQSKTDDPETDRGD